jgi:hypothetical protein
MPSLVQDLASLFVPEPTTHNLPHGSGSAPCSLDLAHNGGPPPHALDCPVPLLDDVREKRAKTKTKFIFAHPPSIPKSKQRLSARPRMVLQLQSVVDGLRPLPAFDIMSSTALASRFTRSVPRLMNGEKCPSTNTLVLFRSDMYGEVDGDSMDGSADESTSHHRDVLGTICFARKAKDGSTNRDEICLKNGLIWEANCLKAGVYEFSGKNHDGLKLRWVLRRSRKSNSKQNSLSETATERSSSRFTFSIINPDARMHPVIATLTRDNKLEILDRFPRVLSSASVSRPTSAPQSPVPSEFSSETSFFDRPTDGLSSYIETDEALQLLIVSTAIWLMSKEGLSEVFSKNLDMVNRLRLDNANGSGSSVVSGTVSGTETTLERSPLSRHIPSRLHRSSISPLSQRVAGMQPASPGRANSTGAPSSRKRTVNAPQSASRSTSLFPSALCSGQGEGKRYGYSFDASGCGKSSSLDSPRPSNSIDFQKRTPYMHSYGFQQEYAKPPASTLRENGFGRGSVDSESVGGEVEKAGQKWRPKKMVRFRAACKSIVRPCIRFS